MLSQTPRTPLTRDCSDENTEAEGMRVKQLPALTGHVDTYLFVEALAWSVACLVALFEAEAAASRLFSAIFSAWSAAFYRLQLSRPSPHWQR